MGTQGELCCSHFTVQSHKCWFAVLAGPFSSTDFLFRGGHSPSSLVKTWGPSHITPRGCCPFSPLHVDNTCWSFHSWSQSRLGSLYPSNTWRGWARRNWVPKLCLVLMTKGQAQLKSLKDSDICASSDRDFLQRLWRPRLKHLALEISSSLIRISAETRGHRGVPQLCRLSPRVHHELDGAEAHQLHSWAALELWQGEQERELCNCPESLPSCSFAELNSL